MLHKYPTCDFSIPLQISPWTHGPYGEFKSAKDVLVLTNPIILLPQAQSPGPGRATLTVKKYLTCVKYCLNVFEQYFGLSRLSPCF